MKILKKIFQVIVKIINHCVPVDSRSLYFIPHPNCRTDKYDIINYSSDNVLVLLNYLLKKDSAEYYKIYVEIYDSSRISEYQEYIYGINPNIRCTFYVHVLDVFSLIKYLLRICCMPFLFL